MLRGLATVNPINNTFLLPSARGISYSLVVKGTPAFLKPSKCVPALLFMA